MGEAGERPVEGLKKLPPMSFELPLKRRPAAGPAGTPGRNRTFASGSGGQCSIH